MALLAFIAAKEFRSNSKWKLLSSEKNFDLTDPEVANAVRKLSADLTELRGGTPYIEARKSFEAKHPAYSRDASMIYFSYKTKGLSVNLQEAAYPLQYNEKGDYVGENCHNVKSVEIRYDPNKFPEQAIARASLGNNPIVLNERTLESDCNTGLSSSLGGMFLDLVFSHINVGQSELRKPNIFISRDTGQVRLWLPRPALGTGDVAWNIVPGFFERHQRRKGGFLLEELKGAYIEPEVVYGTWISSK